MLRYGCTRLEIGVQSVYEDIARDTNRGHTVKAVCESFKLSKDCGFKVVAHMMPDLPNVDFERDMEQFSVSKMARHNFSKVGNAIRFAQWALPIHNNPFMGALFTLSTSLLFRNFLRILPSGRTVSRFIPHW